MTKWHFWGEKQFADVYENIYIRTFMEDWFNIIFTIVKELKGKKSILDLGCGEGHTTKQILDRLNHNYKCDLVEPNEPALIAAESYLAPENTIENCYPSTLSNFKPNKKYDAVFTSHTNYYWAFNEKEYARQLKKLVSLLEKNGKLFILTLPEESDHYNIAIRKIYPSFNYSGYIVKFYKKIGLKVRTKRFKMRIYIGDILNNEKTFDLKSFYRFIHNTDAYPSENESKKFFNKIKKYQKKNYLDFKDDLIIISK